MSNPSLQGEIRIQTRSIQEAVQQVNGLADQINNLGRTNKEFEKVGQEFEQLNRQSKRAADGLRGTTKAQDDSAKSSQRLENLVAKAASRVADFAQRTQQSSNSVEDQNSVVARAYAELTKYSQTLEQGATSGVALQTANTQLQVGLAELNRELKENQSQGQKALQTEAQREKAAGQLTISYERLVAQIQASAMSDDSKRQAVARLNQQYQQSSALIREQGTRTTEGAKAQVAFRRELSTTTEEMRAANREFRGQGIADFNQRMSDLSSSVQVALGPLSGIASRLTAMNALFRRNGPAIAAVVGSMTGFLVVLSRVISVGREAERQIIALDGQVQMLGLSGVTSGRQLSEMATRLGGATLSSAQEMREAQSSLLEFRSIGVDAFEQVLLTAQGLSQTFGGSLAQNTQRLGRLLNDPIRNFDALSRQGIQFNRVERERITILQESGRVGEAQNIILERFASLSDRATSETKGLSGAINGLGDNFESLLEKLYEQSAIGQTATATINRLADAVKDFADSDEAVTLANAFGKAVEFAAGATEFLMNNAKTIGALLIGTMAAGLTRVIVGTINWTFNVDRLTKSLAAAVAAKNAFLTSTTAVTTGLNGAALAARGFGLALRFAVPFIGIATTAFSLLSMTGVFSREQEEQAERMTDKLAMTRLEANSVQEAFANLASASSAVRINMDGFQEAQDQITATTDELNNLQKQFEEVSSSNYQLERVGKDLARLENILVQTYRTGNRELRDAATRQIELVKAMQEVRVERREAIRQGEEHIYVMRAQNEALSPFIQGVEESTRVLTEQLNTNRQLTDSEGQRINSITEEIEKTQRAIQVAKERNDEILAAADNMDELTREEAESLRVGQQLISANEAQVEALKALRQEMRDNSRANREAQREAQRLARVQSDLGEAVRRRAAFEEAANGRITQAQLDSRIAAIAQQKQLERNISTVNELTAASRDLLMASMMLDDATIAWINSAETQEERGQRIATMYGLITQQANAAEEAMRNASAGRDVSMQLRADIDPMTGVVGDRMERFNAIMGIPNEEERERALTDLNAWFSNAAQRLQMERDREMEDVMRFTPLTETEQLDRDFEDRIMVLKERLGEESDLYKEHLAELDQEYKKQRFLTSFGENAQHTADVFAGAMDVMSAAGRDQTKEYQYLALAQSAISQASAISRQFAEAPFPVAVAQAAMVAAQIGAQVASIRSTNFREGGHVGGKGTGKSDSINARLSKGEYVIPKAIVDKMGVGFFDGMLAGDMRGFRDGGSVIPMPVSSGSSRGGVNVQVIDQSTRASGVDAEVEETYDNDGELQLLVYIRDAVRELTSSGQLDKTMGNNFGLKRKGARR